MHGTDSSLSASLRDALTNDLCVASRAENTDKDCCRARGLPDGCGPNPDDNVNCNYLTAICCGEWCKLPGCGCNTGDGCDFVSAPCPSVNPYDPSPSGQTCTDCTNDETCCAPDEVNGVPLPVDSTGCLWGAWLVGFYLVIFWPGALAFLATGCCTKPDGSHKPDWNLGVCTCASCMIALAVVVVRVTMPDHGSDGSASGW